ncbi:putative transaldolase [uncultured archaeon]|nr:putative transaldolase [uncultured archaeon]
MEFFLDTADTNEIKEALSWGILDGVTTNPSLVAKTGKTFEDVAQEIIKLVKGPVSIEAVATDTSNMLEEAREYATWGENVVIKVPMTPEGMKTVVTLTKEQIPTNVTLVFSANQALIAAKAGATYVSPFIGRLDDAGQNGLQILEDIVTIYDNYDFTTKVLAASLRHPIHVLEAAKIGSDVATIPINVMKQLFNHPLTDAGLKRFMEDWKKVPTKKKK